MLRWLVNWLFGTRYLLYREVDGRVDYLGAFLIPEAAQFSAQAVERHPLLWEANMARLNRPSATIRYHIRINH